MFYLIIYIYFVLIILEYDEYYILKRIDYLIQNYIYDLLIIDYLEGTVNKQGYKWEAFVDLFLKKYWDKMYKNKTNLK